MLRRKKKIEVVPESEYTDFSPRYDKKDATLMAGTVATASLATYVWTMPSGEPVTAIEPIQMVAEPMIEPLNVMMNPQPMPVNGDVIQTGIIADSSLNMLATILDPLVQILVAISFPIASVIMVGACFFFMIGRSEKAWDTIFNAGLGYVLVQMSPLFLNILREVGKAV